MKKHKDQRVGVFVDVQNMYYSAKNLYNAKVNFGKILETAIADRKLVRAVAYLIKAQNPEEQKFFEALENQGFELKMKDLQIFTSGLKKGDWDVGITVDVVRLSDKLDVTILVTGDGDFLPLIDYIKNRGQVAEVIAFGESASTKLKEAADDFIDLSEDRKKYLLLPRRILPIRVPGQS